MTECQHCRLKRGRGRPPQHTLWFDVETKTCRALRQHPNYPVARSFQRDARNPPDPMVRYGKAHGSAEHFKLVDRWRDDIAAFTYEMTVEIGIRPDRYHLIWPTDPRQPVGPGNVRWFNRPREGVREARAAQIASLEAQEAIAELLSEADIRSRADGSHLLGAVADRLKHMPSCESQRQGIDPIECSCTEFIRDYFASF